MYMYIIYSTNNRGPCKVFLRLTTVVLDEPCLGELEAGTGGHGVEASGA